MRLLIVMCIFNACQVQGSSTTQVDASPVVNPLLGEWHSAFVSIAFADDSLECVATAGTETSLVEYGQHYFQLEHQVCGFGFVVPVVLGYGELELMRDGQWESYGR